MSIKFIDFSTIYSCLFLLTLLREGLKENQDFKNCYGWLGFKFHLDCFCLWFGEYDFCVITNRKVGGIIFFFILSQKNSFDPSQGKKLISSHSFLGALLLLKVYLR